MAQKSPTKAELLEEIKRLQKMVKELQDDVIAYSQGIVDVENQMDTMRQAFQESYNPYSKGLKPPILGGATVHPTRPWPKVDDHSININIKR